MPNLEKPDEWNDRTYRVLARTNIIPPTVRPIVLAEHLRRQADVLEAMDTGTIYVEEEHLAAVCEVIEGYLDHIYHMAPKVSAWCVISVYDPEGFFNPGGVVIWDACTTKEQAEAHLPYWEKYLNRPRDQFSVDYRPASVGKFLNPHVTPEDTPWRWRR